MFITFEGGEGTGKSTQVKLLAERLRASGRDVLTTREPGGTDQAEQIRTLLVTGLVNKWLAGEEALLIYAARSTHVREVIRPALSQGKTVICDRYIDSTRAYQQYAGSCSPTLLDMLDHHFVSPTTPNLTFIFDLDPFISLQRANVRNAGSEDRFERMGMAFHQNVRDGFLAIAKANGKRCKVIDASRTVEDVSAQIWLAVHG
jgi:dTMP kinase